jgi:hypothetical protein
VPTRRKIHVAQGQPPKEAELIDVNSTNEQWSTYLLADGTVLKLKAVVTEVWRVIGEFDNDGNPQYVTKTGNLLVVNAPDELRRPE